MKNTLLSAALIAATILTSAAQTPEATQQPEQQTQATQTYTKTSIFVQYGFAPITCFKGWTANMFNMYGSGDEVSSTNCGFGAITAGASFDLTDLLELSIPFTYASNTGTFASAVATANSQSFTDNWYSLTPNLKINWYRSTSGKVTLYSRAGIGIGLGTRQHTGSEGTHQDGKAVFSFIASPIGVEVGKNITFFAEGGVGQTGCISVGLRFRFKKTKEGYNSDGTIKQYNWSDHYMR